MQKVVVIGGGASGMIAAIFAAKLNDKVILIEKNEKLGKKIYITGKGRCNLSNNVDPTEFLSSVITNPKFIYSSIYRFSPSDLIDFFSQNGLKLKTERGNRVFPESDKASDVTKTLEKLLSKHGVEIRLNEEVTDICAIDGKVCSVKLKDGEISCDKVIVCTGGVSYPLTGSTGDGYIFAKKFGHKIVPPKPALVGIELKGEQHLTMQGLSLKNVEMRCLLNDKVVYSDFGEMLFTHFGVSGPIVLSASSNLNKIEINKCKILIDLKPALSEKVLNDRLIRELKEANTKSISSVVRSLMPSSLVDVVLLKANVSRDVRACELTAKQRESLVFTIKNLSFDCKKLRDVKEAIVTSGGVDVSQINPKTMESKIVSGLYFAGEVIDVDAYTGGFNLQIAFSTGYVAGNS